jgi:predicted metalloprotease with PDZ domain
LFLPSEEIALSTADFSTSLGLSFSSGRDGNGTGNVNDVWWASPAFKAGITPDMTLVSVNGRVYLPEILKKSILQAERDKRPIQLQFLRGDQYQTIFLAYYDGMRYPHLQRVEGAPDRLDEIMAPSKSPLPAM